MLKKKNRLPARFFHDKYPEQYRNGLFSIKKGRNGLAFSRFAIVITKKAEKYASRRNKLRRSIYRLIQNRKMERVPGYDIIIFASPLALNKAKDGDILFALLELLA